MVFVRKPTGRRKTCLVDRGNFCQQDSGAQKADLVASGVGAEGIRMAVRRAGMETEWHVVSVDVKIASLQAPLVETEHGGKRKITVVRVPSLLRQAGVTDSKYWRVKKPLYYGMSSAPKRWSNDRDKVLADLQVAHGEHTWYLQADTDA